jgi:hypothetical protein
MLRGVRISHIDFLAGYVQINKTGETRTMLNVNIQSNTFQTALKHCAGGLCACLFTATVIVWRPVYKTIMVTISS